MADNASTPRKRSILIINPNTTESMTNALKPLVVSLRIEQTSFDYFTAPCGVPSINNESDAHESTAACLPALQPRIQDYDALLVCCYSHHPLVAELQRHCAASGLGAKPVTGIFEASVAECLEVLDSNQRFGIVSTGKQWQTILGDAVERLLGAVSRSDAAAMYAGTETTGLNADELHSTPKVDVDKRMKAAVERLLMKGVEAICLGCAGMAGLDQVVREACVSFLGSEEGLKIKIVDGVKSGMLFLDGALRN